MSVRLLWGTLFRNTHPTGRAHHGTDLGIATTVC
jgi:hypothetical protein